MLYNIDLFSLYICQHCCHSKGEQSTRQGRQAATTRTWISRILQLQTLLHFFPSQPHFNQDLQQNSN